MGKKIPKYYSFLPETQSPTACTAEFLKFSEKRSILLPYRLPHHRDFPIRSLPKPKIPNEGFSLPDTRLRIGTWSFGLPSAAHPSAAHPSAAHPSAATEATWKLPRRVGWGGTRKECANLSGFHGSAERVDRRHRDPIAPMARHDASKTPGQLGKIVVDP